MDSTNDRLFIKAHIKISALFTIAVSFVVASLTQTAFAHDSPQTGDSSHYASKRCQKVSTSVNLFANDPTPYKLTGWLCWKDSTSHGKTVQVLVHGLTYDHNYWDFPFQPERYSYADAATQNNYVTFNIDRIGAGQSDHPVVPALLTTRSGAHVLHQVVQRLRTGAIGNRAFDKVMLVGHSFGSQVALYEAATYADADAVIITGSMHDVSPQAYTVVTPTMYPAQLDPKFIGAGLAPGYLTTMPGTRGIDFYDTAAANRAVIAKDEKLKQTASATELATVTEGNAVSRQIRVPVLVALGEKDILLCDERLSCASSSVINAREAPHYAPEACLEAFLLPAAGHSINLHPNAPSWFTVANNWSERRVGSIGPPTQPCRYE